MVVPSSVHSVFSVVMAVVAVDVDVNVERRFTTEFTEDMENVNGRDQ